MLRHAWYAVAAGEEVAAAPKAVRLHGEDLVVYRDQTGAVRAVAGHCPHRGCSLALARVDGDDLVCAYHGWRFAADGRLLAVPANRQGAPLPRTRVAAYPAQEAAGLVWVCAAGPETSPSAGADSDADAHRGRHAGPRPLPPPDLPLFPELTEEG